MKQLTKKVAKEVNKNLPSSVTELNTLTKTYSVKLKQCNKKTFETRLKELIDIVNEKLTPPPTPTPTPPPTPTKKKGTWKEQVLIPNSKNKTANKTLNSVLKTAISNHETETDILTDIQYKLLKLIFIPTNKTVSNFDYMAKMKSEIKMKPSKQFDINYSNFEMLKATRRLLESSKFVAQINKDYKA